MSKKRNKGPVLKCIAYISVDADEQNLQEKQEKQLRYIQDYCKGHRIKIVGKIRTCYDSKQTVTRHFWGLAKMVTEGQIDGVVVANTNAIAENESDAYTKIGRINAAGGKFYSVDEGLLGLDLKSLR